MMTAEQIRDLIDRARKVSALAHAEWMRRAEESGPEALQNDDFQELNRIWGELGQLDIALSADHARALQNRPLEMSNDQLLEAKTNIGDYENYLESLGLN